MKKIVLKKEEFKVAINPMQRKARNSFLLGMILTLLVTGVVIVLLFLQMKKLNDAKAAEEAAKVNVYTINQDVKSGQIITNDMLVKLNVNNAAPITIPVKTVFFTLVNFIESSL